MNRDGMRLVAAAEDEIGEHAAVAWVHMAALSRHAVISGLIPEPAPADPASEIRSAAGWLAASHPALAGFAGQAVAPIWDSAPSPDMAGRMARLWREADLADPRADGYVIGDLYQELSADARKGRALCQTPQFVTRLLLDLSYGNAVRERGGEIRLIDPACGTGHILIESLLRAGAAGSLDAAGRALDVVHGVDIDPYAVLIARYRLLAAACRWGGRGLALRELPGDLPVQVECADSLLSESEPLLRRSQYHVVIANPPYITPKDGTQRDAIRLRYRLVCSGKYALSVPFEVLMHELCVPGGWVARLTGNAFMKREFGKKLIEDYFPTIDLRWVIDTSGAYIPGHGTPTVILVSRNQPPSSPSVCTIQGVRGEPSQPADPAKGVVWQAIARAVREREAFMRFAGALEAVQPRSRALPATEAGVGQQGDLLELIAQMEAA